MISGASEQELELANARADIMLALNEMFSNYDSILVLDKYTEKLEEENQQLKDRNLIIAAELEKLQNENQQLKEEYNKAIHEATEFESKVYELQDIITELKKQNS